MKELSILISQILIGTNAGVIINKKIKDSKTPDHNNFVIYDCNNAKMQTRTNINLIEIKEIIPFIKKMEKYTSEENLNTLYNNLQSITIRRDFTNILFGIIRAYNVRKNEISFLLESNLEHEFLHLASSFYDKKNKVSFSGFRQIKNNISIGEGLNEGYTELLRSRIYNKNFSMSFYKKQMRIAQLLELFFDNPKEMENLYFNYNLNDLIKHLEGYAKRGNIIKLLLDIDDILDFSYGIGNPIPNYKFIKIQLTLYNWFVAKNDNKHKLNNFTDVLYENKIIKLLIQNKNIEIYNNQFLKANKHKIKKI